MHEVPAHRISMHYLISFSQQPYEVLQLPLLQVRKLRFREVRPFAQGHTANK